MNFKWIKYIFGPVIVDNVNNIAIRKRIFHKGYQILKVDYVFHDILNNEILYEHIIYTDSLEETQIFIYNRYGIKINL